MTTLEIAGMSCGHWVNTVGEALAEVPGVGRIAAVSFDRGRAPVEGDADTDALVAAVQAHGDQAQASS